MIRRTNTAGEFEEVERYLLSKKTAPATNQLYYKKNADGDVIGAYGIEAKLCVEPLQSENKVTSLELFSDAIATARSLNVDKVHFFTTNPKVVEHLKENEGAIVWGVGLTELIIKL